MTEKIPRGIKVYGIAWIVLSVLMVSSLPILFLICGPDAFLAGGNAVLLLSALVGLLINLAVIAFGIGILMLRNWARRGLLVFVVIDMLAVLLFLLSQLDFFNVVTSEGMFAIHTLTMRLKYLFMSSLNLILIVFLSFLAVNLYYFNLRAVKGRFK